MSNIKLLGFALCLIVIGQSCIKENTTVTADEFIEASITSVEKKLTQEEIDFFKSQGVIPWELRTEMDMLEEQGELDSRGKEGGTCNCFYTVSQVVVDDVLPPLIPTDYPNTRVRFLTPDDECAEGFNCNYFEGIHCNNVIPCNDDWPFLPSCDPEAPGYINDYDCSLTYDFKCPIDRFSEFDVVINAWRRDSECTSASYGRTGFIRFKLYCVEPIEDPTCGGYGFSTNEVIMNLSSAGVASATFALGQGNTCGCDIKLKM